MTKQKFASADGGGFNRETWLTPPHILQALGPFDLDPCAAPSPRPWPTAAQHIELPVNGLEQPWHGRVWCNPPYGAEAARWLAKLADHGNGIALVFARTETGMFFSQVWPKAHGILFLKGRLAFCHANGKPADAAGAPSCLIAYGEDNARTLRRCRLEGHFVPLEPQAATQPGLAL
ncbi:MAG: DNA N-6-adenine-methyltransferase [Elusimicrobiales bacterium]